MICLNIIVNMKLVRIILFLFLFTIHHFLELTTILDDPTSFAQILLSYKTGKYLMRARYKSETRNFWLEKDVDTLAILNSEQQSRGKEEMMKLSQLVEDCENEMSKYETILLNKMSVYDGAIRAKVEGKEKALSGNNEKLFPQNLE